MYTSPSPTPTLPTPLASAPMFSFGIEEEYFIVGAGGERVVKQRKPKFMADCGKALGGIVTAEMMQSQIEVATPVLTEMAEARRELRFARRTIADIGRRHGVAIAAAGTFPPAVWREQRVTPKRRYTAIQSELQIVGRRNVLCGLHVHVAPPDNASRVDLMNRALPFLPVFLALSTSSPFWQKQLTGLKGYRLAAYDELPRTGLPAVFRNEGDYQVFIDLLVKSGAITSPSHIWWAIRPSSRYPTLELRIADSCTFLEDAVCIAAMFRCLIRALWRDPTLNADITPMGRLIADENRWRAQRFGVQGTFINSARACLEPIGEVVTRLVETIAEDADALGCRAEVAHARRILARGTSADIQIKVYDAARREGAAPGRALAAVSRWLTAATQSDNDEVVPPAERGPATSATV